MTVFLLGMFFGSVAAALLGLIDRIVRRRRERRRQLTRLRSPLAWNR